MFESSRNHPLPTPTVHGKVVFHETSPGAKKVGDRCSRGKTDNEQIHKSRMSVMITALKNVKWEEEARET